MKRLLVIISIICLTLPMRAQLIGVNTDVAMDILMTPSVGVEITMTKKSTLNINGMFGKNLFGRDVRFNAIQPEWRIYMSGRPMYHHYCGVIGLFASYKTRYDKKWHDGDCGGLGVSLGYVWPLTNRLSIDFHTSLGVIRYHQKEYTDEEGYDYDSEHLNSDGYPMANARGTRFLPLRIGISVAYIIK